MKSSKNSILGKLPISKVIEHCRLPLAIMSFTHSYFVKHPCYSWQNNPSGSNSTIMNNVDAIYRHLIAHSMGKLIDDEGLPHIFGVLTRLEMLTTMVYREEKPTNLKLFHSEKEIDLHQHPRRYAYQHTPEVYLSLTKLFHYPEKMKFAEYDSFPALLMLLDDISKYESLGISHLTSQFIFDTIFPVDELLYHGIKYSLDNLQGMKDVNLDDQPHFVQQKYKFLMNMAEDLKLI